VAGILGEAIYSPYDITGDPISFETFIMCFNLKLLKEQSFFGGLGMILMLQSEKDYLEPQLEALPGF